MKSSKKIWKRVVERLHDIYVPEEAESIAYILLEDIFEVSRVDILLDQEVEVDEYTLNVAIGRLIKNEPVQYVTGITYFLGRKFQVEEGVLIPRPETEELVRWIVEDNKGSESKMLDVGTGAGCIVISLVLEMESIAFATDISPDAISITKANSDFFGVNVEVMHHDILVEDLPVQNLDILASNPPYIPRRERSQMHESVLGFEPEIALFVPNEDPLIFYKKIADAGLKSLKSGGKVYFEIHEKFDSEVSSYLSERGYQDIIIHKDIQGKERMIRATNMKK